MQAGGEEAVRWGSSKRGPTAAARAPGSVREATRRWGRGTIFGGERPRSRSTRGKGKEIGGIVGGMWGAARVSIGWTVGLMGEWVAGWAGQAA